MAVYFIFSCLAALMLRLTAEPAESSSIRRKFQRNLCAVRASWQEFMPFGQPLRKPTGVVLPIFSLLHSHGHKNCHKQKVNRDFHQSKLKKLTLKWSVTKWKDKNCKIIPLTHQRPSDVASAQWLWNRRLLTFNHNFPMRRNLRGTAFD